MKIKETFEKSGNINNFFYVRACAIIKGEPDPLDKVFKDFNSEGLTG